jgi:hypothetical protein
MTSFWHKAARQSQERCDAIQSEFRSEPAQRRSIRRESPSSSTALESTEDVLNLRLAEELEYARRMLEAMGDELSSDRFLLSRHVTALQSIDVVGQVLGHVASVIRARDPPGAVEGMGLSVLLARLKRRRFD